METDGNGWKRMETLKTDGNGRRKPEGKPEDPSCLPPVSLLSPSCLPPVSILSLSCLPPVSLLSPSCLPPDHRMETDGNGWKRLETDGNGWKRYLLLEETKRNETVRLNNHRKRIETKRPGSGRNGPKWLVILRNIHPPNQPPSYRPCESHFVGLGPWFGLTFIIIEVIPNQSRSKLEPDRTDLEPNRIIIYQIKNQEPDRTE